MGAERLALPGTFAGAARGYWLSVFPVVCRELRRWRELAWRIPDPGARELALHALAKRGNMEGAAAFATFVPRARRAAVVRATVAFQTAYNHLDVLSERSLSGGGAGDAQGGDAQFCRRLHEPLLAMLDLARGPEVGQGRADDRYLSAVVDACRQALLELPSYGAVAPFALRAAERVICFQAFSSARTEEGRVAMERWASEQTPPDTDLRWWETLASAGSSLGVHMAIAAGAASRADAASPAAVESAYFPWIGALHSMLDQLVDVEEDARAGQCNLIGHYASFEEAAARMGLLAERALGAARALPPPHRHELIVAAMASFYLASPHARTAEAAPIAAAVLDALGPLAGPSLLVFKVRGALTRTPRVGRRGKHRIAGPGTEERI